MVARTAHDSPRPSHPLDGWIRRAANRALVPVFYALVSLMFTGLYLQTTTAWSDADYDACAYQYGPYPGFGQIFRARVLVPWLARIVCRIPGIDSRLAFEGLVVLFVFGLLVAYRKYLTNFLRPDAAGLLSLCIIYPLLWNYALLNRIYYPFDIPSVLLFTLGCHFIYRTNWPAYYATLVLATLNRDSSFLLIFAFLFCLFTTLSPRRMARHVLIQAVVWVALRWSLHAWRGTGTCAFWEFHTSPVFIAHNRRVVADMLTMRGNALKDWAKLGLFCGGLWWITPWLLRGQPRFIRRCLLVVFPTIAAVACRAIVDEVRGCGETIPVILTPIVYAIAQRLGGVTNLGHEGSANAGGRGDQVEEESRPRTLAERARRGRPLPPPPAFVV